MGASKKLEPVKHCRADNPIGVSALAQRLLSKGIYANPLTFNNPWVLKSVFQKSSDELAQLIIDAVGSTPLKKLRNQKSIELHTYLTTLVNYAKPICNGDIVKINLSGFDCNIIPSRHLVPEQVVIDRIVMGKANGTYKIYLVRKKNKPGVKKDIKTHMVGVTYIIEISTTPDIPESWVQKEGGLTINELVFSNVVSNVKLWVRVIPKNAAGKGQPSIPYPYTPQ